MEVIVNYIIEYAAIWGPALTAIIGSVAIFIKAFAKIKDAVKEVKDEESIRDLKKEVEISNMLNRQTRDELRVLTEELARIKDYGKEREQVKDE